MVWGRAFDAGLVLARGRKMKVVMDGNGGAGIPRRPRRPARCPPWMLSPNEREAQHSPATGAVAALHGLGRICHLPVVKAGASGSYALVDGEVLHAPAISVVPVDTTGAGDCYDAGFIKAWLEGRTVEECLRWGNAVGGLSTMAWGGAGRVITPGDLAPYLA